MDSTVTVPTPHRRRLPVALIAALVAIAVPALAFANHQFGDVPTASTYHDDVEALVGAGITSGCGGGNYCPGQSVTRGQMAAFLNRGLGIATAAYGEIPIEASIEDYVVVATIPAGASSGGTGYLTVSADLTVFMSGGLCPCGTIVGVENITTGDSSPVTSFVVPGDMVSDAQAASGSVSWTFEVPTGVEYELGVWAFVFPETAEPLGAGPEGEPVPSVGDLEAMITAEYSPFGSAPDGGGPIKTGTSLDTQFGRVTVGDRSP